MRKYKFSGELVCPIENNTILENVRFLITNYEIRETDALAKLSQQIAGKSASFVVIAPKFSESAIREITTAFENIEHEDIGAACFSVGESDLEILQDIAVVTNGNLIVEELGLSLKSIHISALGTAKTTCIVATCLEITGGQGRSNDVRGLVKSIMCKIKDTANHDRKARLIHRYENLTGQPVREWPGYEPYRERNISGWQLPYGYASAHLCNVAEPPLRVELSQCCVVASTRPVSISVRSSESQKSEGGIVYPEILKVGIDEDNIIPLLEQVSKKRFSFLLIAPHIRKEVLSTVVVNKLRGILCCAAINTCGDTQVIEKMRQELGIKVIDETQKLGKVSLTELSVFKKVIILDDLSIFQL